MYLSNLKGLLILLLLWLASVPAWAQQESITYDPATESYIYRYRGYEIHVDGKQVDLGIVQGIFTPAKIVPKVLSGFRTDKDWAINYRYTLVNDKSAKQVINNFEIGVLPNPLMGELPALPGSTPEQFDEHLISQTKSVLKPNLWGGANNDGLVRWMPSVELGNNGLSPAERAIGFGYASFDLPGIVQARLVGEGTSTGFDDSNSGPDETSPLREQDDLITHEDYKPYPVAAPMVVVPQPFDAAVVVENIRTHVATWPNFKTGGYNGNVPPDKKIFLLEAAFAAQLDRYLAAVADAFRHNQPKVARENIEELRKMLKREHHDLDQENEHADERDHDKDAKRPLISRLAARVLDFDLDYVLERTEGDRHGRD